MSAAAGKRGADPVPDAERNRHVARQLREAASALEAQGDQPFRARAYRRAADTVDALQEDVGDLLAREGPAGLEALPAIGTGIASAIAEMVTTGRWSRLDRLRGELDPEDLLRTVPGIGPELAARIHDTLHVDTLEGLESAAHDGSLARVPGIGQRRLEALRAALEVMLRRRRPRRTPPGSEGPAVSVLLDVDDEYRRRAQRGELARIAPRRFNPEHVRWLPILHTQRGSWHFTVLFSNTARAHELDRTSDWVVIYFDDGSHQESQCTVVTETRGPLAGRRVIRGREAACREWYRQEQGGPK